MTDQPPALSVLIPSRRRADLLRLCLSSVLRFAPPRTEVIVVDDASPGGTVSAAASEFDGVRVVRLPRPAGFCVAANTGIAAARGTVVELLNDDTQVTAGWADAALARFADASIAAVAPLVLCGPPANSPPRIDSAGDLYDPGGFALKRFRREPLSPRHLRAGPVFGASASSAFYRRDVLQSVGAFPESFGAYFEDVDLSFRIRAAGHQIWFEPGSVVWHRVSASYGTAARRLLERQSLNEERVFWRNVPRGRVLRSIPRHVAVLAGKSLRRWNEGTLWPFLTGRLRMLAEVGATLRHRRLRPPAAEWVRGAG